MNPFNIWKWPIDVYEDIRQWKLVNDALKEPETLQAFKRFPYELRIDRIGRIYTVINIPDELLPLDKKDQVWPWVLEQLRELDEILMEVRLNELVFPEVTKIEEYPSYLVVLTPSTESFSVGKAFSWIFNVGFVSLLSYLSNKLIIKLTGDSVNDILYNTFF
jgi:hypothetical protein